MSESFGGMLSDLRVKAGYANTSQLAKVSGVSSAVLSRLQNNFSMPRPDTLKKLAPYLRVSYEDLMRMAGHLPDKDEEIEWEELANADEEQPISVLVFEDFDTDKRWGKYVGTEHIPPGYRGSKYIYIVAQDDDMKLFDIKKRDLVLIRLDEVPENGDVVAVAENGRLVLRCYIRSMNIVHLMKDQPRNEPIESYSVEELQVFGKAVRVISSLE